MSATIDQQPQHQPAPQPPSTDPVLPLVVGIVVVLVLAATGYLCVVYRSLAGPIGCAAGVPSGNGWAGGGSGCARGDVLWVWRKSMHAVFGVIDFALVTRQHDRAGPWFAVGGASSSQGAGGSLSIWASRNLRIQGLVRGGVE